MTDSRYLSAKEAADALDIRRATLYSYVSRGLVRSEPARDDSRARRYYREDIEELQRRKDVRRNPDGGGKQALHWGTPVLESELTLIDGGRLYYRGQDTLQLAETASFEEVAALLWTGDRERATTLFGSCLDFEVPQMAGASRLAPMERFQAFLPLAAAEDVTAYDLRPDAVARAGARILHLFTCIAANVERIEDGIAVTLQQAWREKDLSAADLIDMALILCADHELNVSSFTARCAASADATPYAAVHAGLATLSGTKHGGSSEQVEAFLREVGTSTQAQAAVVRRLRRGERIPGFGHRLYPEGDPRAELLLSHIRQLYPNSLADAVIDAVREALHEKPNIDMALATLTNSLDLTAGAALSLFAIGRTAGWIAHAIEQYEKDELIRPRARYVGKMPTDSGRA